MGVPSLYGATQQGQGCRGLQQPSGAADKENAFATLPDERKCSVHTLTIQSSPDLMLTPLENTQKRNNLAPHPPLAGSHKGTSSSPCLIFF